MDPAVILSTHLPPAIGRNRELFKPIADRLVSELAPAPGERALDIGCGRGAVLIPLARAVTASGRTVGIDLSPGMVKAAEEEANRAGIVTEIRVGDAQAPGLEPESFDLVASSLVLFFLPDPKAALRAWHGLLVPGGRMGTSTFGEFTPEWHRVDEVFVPYLPPAMVDPRTRTTGTPFESDAGMEALVGDAGFKDVRTATMTVPVRFPEKDDWYRWTWSVGQRRIWEAIDADRREEVRALAYERLDTCRDAQGRIGFDQIVRFTFGRR